MEKTKKIIKVHKKSRKKDKIKKKDTGTSSSQYLVASVPALALTTNIYLGLSNVTFTHLNTSNNAFQK